MSYSIEVIAAAKRVADTFATGCDRCSHDDLDALEAADLMHRRTCSKEDEELQDSVEAGEPLYEFNQKGEELCRAILGET